MDGGGPLHGVSGSEGVQGPWPRVDVHGVGVTQSPPTPYPDASAHPHDLLGVGAGRRVVHELSHWV